jgi:hypothetical protein
MHIAAAVTSNLVSIHTWSNPRRVGPYNSAAWIWKSGRLLRVSELDSATEASKGRLFRREDVPAVAEIALRNLIAQPVT